MSEKERRFRKATIKDVARRAGVSTTTVSVFVGGRESVCSPETAERIRAAVAELNYTPSSLISAAQTKVTRTIGVCMRSPLDPVVYYGNLFYERLWRGITSQADAEDYSLLHYPVSVREAQDDGVDAFLDGRVDGVLFHAHENRRPGKVASAGMPTVLLTRSLNLPDGAGAAYADEVQGVGLALDYLWELGHRRIAHIAGPIGGEGGVIVPGTGFVAADDVALERLYAYQKWMEAHDAYTPSLVFRAGSWRAEPVAAIVTRWRESPEPPTAVLCANDALAIGVIRAAQERGWRVPDDLSVVGIDNSAAGLECAPTLTSVDILLEEVGRESVRCLLRLMEGAPLEQCRVALPVSQLVARESASPPGRPKE